MKRVALYAALVLALSATAPVRADERATVNFAAAASASALAPADRYFGPLAMSVLGIRNAVRDISSRIDGAVADDGERLAKYYHKLTCVEDSLLDLKQKFPNDTWIPGLGFGLAKTYLKLHGGDALVRANDTIDWLIAEYPHSGEAMSARDLRAARLTQASDDVPIEPVASP
jgi:hypothetical protein